MRIRFLVLALIFSASLWGILAHLSATPLQASYCSTPYVVQRGDRLAAIARRLDTTVNELARLNPQLYQRLYWLPPRERLNWLFTGETLCLPERQQSPQLTPPPLAPTIFLSLEATFPITRSDEMTLSLRVPDDYFAGTRTAVPIQATEPLKFITDTFGVQELLAAQPAPALIAIQNRIVKPDGTFGAALPNFTLYEIDSTTHLDSLRLDSQKPLAIPSGCDATEIHSAFGIDPSAHMSMTLTAWVENNGGRFPFVVSEVGVLSSSDIDDCPFAQMDDDRAMVAMALVPAGSGSSKSYQVVLQVRDNSGPCLHCFYNDVCRAVRGYYGYQIVCGYR